MSLPGAAAEIASDGNTESKGRKKQTNTHNQSLNHPYVHHHSFVSLHIREFRVQFATEFNMFIIKGSTGSSSMAQCLSACANCHSFVFSTAADILGRIVTAGET